MSYKVKKKNDYYQIVENDVKCVISYETREEANDVCRGLNLGKGFTGWTPNFFCREYETPRAF
mgnify:CR=1 FL=1